MQSISISVDEEEFLPTSSYAVAAASETVRVRPRRCLAVGPRSSLASSTVAGMAGKRTYLKFRALENVE